MDNVPPKISSVRRNHDVTKQKYYGETIPTGCMEFDVEDKPRERSELSFVRRKRAEKDGIWVMTLKKRNRDYFIETAENIPEDLRHELWRDASTKLKMYFKESNVANGELDEDGQQSPGKFRLQEDSTTTSKSAFIYAKKRRRVSDSTPESHDSEQATTNPPVVPDLGWSETISDDELPQDRPRISIHLHDKERWKPWFLAAFAIIQQQGCRIVAKEWIKLLHPKKQSTHPYNGNMPRNEKRSPERTKPPYWPKDVLHKEPDHIDKNARTTLLTHLIMNTPQQEITTETSKLSKTFYATDLLAVLEKKQDPHLRNKMSIIRELIDTRTELERFEDGGYGDDQEAYITITDWEAHLRQGSRNTKSNTQKGKREDKKSESNIQDNSIVNGDEDIDECVVVDSPGTSQSSTDGELINEPEHEEVTESELTTSFSTTAPQDYHVKSKPPLQYCEMQQNYDYDAAQASGFGIVNSNTNPPPSYVPQRARNLDFPRRHTIPIGGQFSQPPWQMMDNSVPQYMMGYDSGLQELQNPMMMSMKHDDMLPHRPRGLIPDAMPLNTYDGGTGLPYLDACQSGSLYLNPTSDMRNTGVTHGYDLCHQNDMKNASGDTEPYYGM